MTRADIVPLLRSAIEPWGMRLAVLFGSAARGTSRPDSDLDVGIVPHDPTLPLSDELALQSAIEQAAERTVDLVRLDRASTLLRWRVAREGIPLLAVPAFAWPRFVAQAAIEHGDFALQYARAAERYRQRVAAGSGR